LIGEDIVLTYRLAADLWNVSIDPVQLDQIVMNLAINARDAMPDGGEFTITTVNTTVDGDYCLRHNDASPGEYVRLTFSDTGHGMDDLTRMHIFEPFYTTKEVGKGTGLGLATVYGIVTQNNGFVSVYSEPGLGTKFSIYLPRLCEELTSEFALAEAPLKGTGTILLVEDDDAVCKMTISMLESIGYAVISAALPREALRICADMNTGIDLVISDVIMPEMDGKAMMDRIKEIRPGIRVLFMSGYSADHVSEKGVMDGNVHFIQKPFNMICLSEKIRELLEA
jgi:two-component system cell cycle sensor histidine kinase/response regulator CckA